VRLRVIQPFSLPEVLSTHGYVVYFLTPFLNMVPIMRKERILKKKQTITQLAPFLTLKSLN
jgi:hypothetical protein